MIQSTQKITTTVKRRCIGCGKDIEPLTECWKEVVQRRTDRFKNRYLCIECKEKEELY